MVRNVDLLQPDKVFYEAGMACKVVGGQFSPISLPGLQEVGGEYTNMAFVFLNQYLDIVDAIEEGDTGVVDNSIFEGTGIE